MNTEKLIAALLGALLIMSWPLVSYAHVHMDRSVPEDHAHLNKAPKSVQVWFSGGVAAEWSKIIVTDANGERVDHGAVANAAGPKQLSIDLKPLVPGVYEVKLNVISGDGHRVKGSFSFTVE